MKSAPTFIKFLRPNFDEKQAKDIFATICEQVKAEGYDIELKDFILTEPRHWFVCETHKPASEIRPNTKEVNTVIEKFLDQYVYEIVNGGIEINETKQ